MHVLSINNSQEKMLTPVSILSNIYNFIGPGKSPDNGFGEYTYI